MMKPFFFCLFTFCCLLNAQAQQGCYDVMLNDGDNYLKQGNTEQAVREWQSALKNCSPDANQRVILNSRIQKAQEALNPPAPAFEVPVTVFVQGGTFRMGSEDGDSDEKPVHSVTVSSFNMGKFEITVAQFKAFVDDAGYNGKTDAETDGGSYVWTGSKWDKKAGINWRHDEEGATRTNLNYPVVHVSWNDATAYCQWLSRKTGKNYRLPTEAEWEYAAGNGTKHTKYSWGNSDPSSSKGGNVADETAKSKFPSWTTFSGYSDGYVYAAPIGSFTANDFGIYDMTGNVWEWCGDWKGEYSSSSQKDPTGAVSGSYRVFRGGCWFNAPQFCRVAYRDNSAPTNRSNYIGFRVVLPSQ